MAPPLRVLLQHTSFISMRRSSALRFTPFILFLGACMPSPSTAPTPAQAAAVPGAPHAIPNEVRPYASVITKAAKTRRGMFDVHQIGDTLYFEIPRHELNKDMLLVGRFARAAVVDESNPFGAYGGDEFGERTVRWERMGNRIILRSPSFAIMADTSLPVYRAVRAGNYAPIIATFPIKAYGPDSSAVIDVTRLYTTGVPEFKAITGQIDEKRSFIESAIAFPDNVEVEATQTGTPQPFGLPGRPVLRSPDGEAESVLAHWSMVRLPKHPMMPRLADKRVGFFGLTRTDFGSQQFRSVDRTYIARWRLVKKHPGAALSDPVKPLVYYIDPATPAEWKPWIRKAVLDWQPAFERAGFTNAIIPKDPPANDPDWSPEDVRHTVIRWLPSTVENAVGPHISDPRTGEILNGSIRIFHNVLNLQRDWYFTQVAPLDPRAQTWPMPDSLMGRLLEFVVAHEIGHTLGLYHNHLASSMYPADSVRSRTWVHRMGFAPSIMDYARFDYVAQPEDSIAVGDLVPRVGPYDRFAIMWGYTPIPRARTPEAERPALDSIARMQDSVPWYRFGHLAETRADDPDPGDETEAVGDADAVKSTGYGLLNIERIMPMLLHATQKPTEDNSDLAEIYGRLIGQWTTEMGHVVHEVGGVHQHTRYGSQPGPVYTPEPRADQVAAVKFLNTNVFRTPRFFLDPAVTSRIEVDGPLRQIHAAQYRILQALLDNSRLQRVIETAAAPPVGGAYTLPELLGDVQQGIWSELGARHVTVGVYRRNLQRAYLDLLGSRINPRPPTFVVNGSPFRYTAPLQPSAMADVRALMRAELVTLRQQVVAALPRATDTETRAHLADVRTQIDRILHPNR